MRSKFTEERQFRTLNAIDTFTRECLVIEVDHSLPGARVVRVLQGLVERYGHPEAVWTDNGTEFTSNVVDPWAWSCIPMQQLARSPARWRLVAT